MHILKVIKAKSKEQSQVGKIIWLGVVEFVLRPLQLEVGLPRINET